MAQDPDNDRIAAKAHALWEAEGHPHGRDQDHWIQAREMVAIEDSQRSTLLPRDTGAEEPIEEPDEALRNLADVPNLTDQGENLLTSTDREPDFLATPSGRRGKMPKSEVPTSGQPGMSSSKSDQKAPKPVAAAPPLKVQSPASARSEAKTDTKGPDPSKGAGGTAASKSPKDNASKRAGGREKSK